MRENRRRPLVLRHEGVRHPFRQQMPMKFFEFDAHVVAVEAKADRKSRWLNEDTSLFVLSFLAFFTAFYLFIF